MGSTDGKLDQTPLVNPDGPMTDYCASDPGLLPVMGESRVTSWRETNSYLLELIGKHTTQWVWLYAQGFSFNVPCERRQTRQKTNETEANEVPGSRPNAEMVGKIKPNTIQLREILGWL